MYNTYNVTFGFEIECQHKNGGSVSTYNVHLIFFKPKRMTVRVHAKLRWHDMSHVHRTTLLGGISWQCSCKGWTLAVSCRLARPDVGNRRALCSRPPRADRLHMWRHRCRRGFAPQAERRKERGRGQPGELCTAVDASWRQRVEKMVAWIRKAMLKRVC